jgi:hypothetical protein
MKKGLREGEGVGSMRLRGDFWHCGRLERAWESLPTQRPFEWVKGSHEIIMRLRSAIPGKRDPRSENLDLGILTVPELS